jgi:branched-chain amino acid transport system substrate-binding protein
MKTAAVLSVVLVLPILAACSSSKSSGTSSTTSTGGAAASKVSGQPVLVNMNVALTGPITFPQDKTAAVVAQDAINAAGGIHGRPLKVIFCDGQSPVDPSPSIRCTQSAANNSQVVAEVGDYTAFGDEITPILHSAGLVDIGNVPLAAPQLSLDNSFPLIASEGGALGECIVDQGIKSVGLAYIDIPAGSQSIAFGNLFLGKGRGTSYAKSVPVALTATDMTPQVTSLTSSAGVALSLAPTQVTQFLKDHAVVAPNQPVCSSGLGTLPSDLSTLGSLANKLYLVYGLPLINGDNPGIAVFKKQMAQYSPSTTLDETMLNAWLAVTAFAQVANQTTGAVTRAAELHAWQGLTSFQVDGLLPPDLNLKTSPLGIPALARLTNVWVQYGQVNNGQVQPVGSGGYTNMVTKS